MRRPELSPRLRMVGELVPAGARLADVGTDHAYLPAALMLEGKIPWAIAADLRWGPLDRARATAREYGLAGKLAFRLCDGLTGIQPGEVDAVAAAGFSLSRGKAAGLIASGKVALNHRECLKADRQVSEGDVLTCRGLGKCVVREVPGHSKKGRTMLVIDRYL